MGGLLRITTKRRIMKIRKDFVTNSSSSSFVVAFEKVPESVTEMKDMLFKGEEDFVNVYSGTAYPTSQVAEIVLNDMIVQYNKPEELVGEFCGLVDSEIYSYSYGQKIDWREYNRVLNVKALERAKAFVQDNPGCVFYVFEYSDNDGDLFTAMEHCHLFKRMPHVTISKH
jgi:hypothetical protein